MVQTQPLLHVFLSFFALTCLVYMLILHCALTVGQVGQVHGGLMGVVQRAMVRSCPHVWFERDEMKDRHLVTKRWVRTILLSRLFSWQLFRPWVAFLLLPLFKKF